MRMPPNPRVLPFCSTALVTACAPPLWIEQGGSFDLPRAAPLEGRTRSEAPISNPLREGRSTAR